MCYTFNPIDLSKDLFQFEPFFTVSIARFCTVVLFLVATLNWRHPILFLKVPYRQESRKLLDDLYSALFFVYSNYP